MILKGALTNLGKYNEGELDFVWVEFPCDESTYENALNEIGIDGVNYEETFWSDWDCDVPQISKELGEYEQLDNLNRIVELVDEIDNDEKAGAIAEYYGLDDLENHENYYYISKSDCGYSDEDFGYYVVDEFYGGAEHLAQDTLERYFDYDSFGRDAKFDYHETEDGYLSAY